MCKTIALRTLKAAYADGWHDKRPEEYGGEEIRLKGHDLIRSAKRAASATEWHYRGRRVRPGEIPHCYLTRYYGRLVTFGVYREEQTEPRTMRGPVAAATAIEVLAAVWTINRHAKRLRDRADVQYEYRRPDLAKKTAARKRELYSFKGQALHHLLAEGRLAVVGYHTFEDRLWAELLEGGGYRFHRPCPPRDDAEEVDRIGGIEAKPLKSGEPRLRDALLTLEAYLDGKPQVDLYEWPPRPRRSNRVSIDEDDWEDEDWEDEDWEDEAFG